GALGTAEDLPVALRGIKVFDQVVGNRSLLSGRSEQGNGMRRRWQQCRIGPLHGSPPCLPQLLLGLTAKGLVDQPVLEQRVAEHKGAPRSRVGALRYYRIMQHVCVAERNRKLAVIERRVAAPDCRCDRTLQDVLRTEDSKFPGVDKVVDRRSVLTYQL